MRDSTLDRREFTRLSLLSMLSGVVITISGCGGGGSNPGNPTPNPTPTPTPPSDGSKEANISANHGHRAVITAAQLTAGGDLTLSLGPSVGVVLHSHSVTLTGAEVVSIRDGARVGKRSTLADSGDAHDHTVTFNP